jgi:DNA-directed RNA polymerase subunit H (RpoH/RPB5)
MSNHFTLIDAIYKSRITLLDLLEARGYDVERYRNFTPDEAALAVAHYNGLSFKVTKPGTDPVQTCDVRYATITRQNLDKFFTENYTDEEAPHTEVVVMLQTPLADAHHVCALKQYIKFKKDSATERRNLRVSFFYINAIVINPLKHVLVPKHEIVPKEQHKELMDSLYVISKSKFPEIKFHVDPITRCIGAVPGDIIKITRPSGSSGEAIIYRVCIA